MKINVIKCNDGIVAVYEGFVCAPVFVKSDKDLNDAVIDEVYRTCYILERKSPKDGDKVEIISKRVYNGSAESFLKEIFTAKPFTAKEIKEYKNLYLQAMFSFKSLTDNIDENSREKAVKTYLNYVKNDVLQFEAVSDFEHLMETAFFMLEFIDGMSNPTELLLILNARIIWFAREVFDKTDKKNDPFYFSA